MIENALFAVVVKYLDSESSQFLAIAIDEFCSNVHALLDRPRELYGNHIGVSTTLFLSYLASIVMVASGVT